MKIVTLVENTATREDLVAEHGLSLYIETGKHKILFDTGASHAFADNAAKRGIDLGAVDMAVLSHSHCDHSGGLGHFMEINHIAPVYLRPEVFQSCYNAQGEYIGPDRKLQGNHRLCFTSDRQSLDEGITLFSGNDLEKVVPIDSAGLTVQRDGVYAPDDFLHEQYLLIREDNKQVLISGCSHKGILNITKWFSPDVLIGGFHYMKVEAHDPMLVNAANMLLQYPTVYYTGHCTGLAQFGVMKEIMKDRLHSLSTGVTIEI